MTITKSEVHINDVKLFARIGVSEQENVVGNIFIVNARVVADYEAAACADDLTATVNYYEVLKIIEQEMAVTVRLMETVAYRICRRVLDELTHACGVEISIMKENPPMEADVASAGVVLAMKK